MADELNPKRTAITVGTFAALVHAVWAAIVALGFAQGLLNWAMRLHFLNIAITVSAFGAITAATLVVVAFIGGAAAGWIFSLAWNWAKKCK